MHWELVDWDEIPLVKSWLNCDHRSAMDNTTQKSTKTFSEDQLARGIYKKED